MNHDIIGAVDEDENNNTKQEKIQLSTNNHEIIDLVDDCDEHSEDEDNEDIINYPKEIVLLEETEEKEKTKPVENTFYTKVMKSSITNVGVDFNQDHEKDHDLELDESQDQLFVEELKIKKKKKKNKKRKYEGDEINESQIENDSSVIKKSRKEKKKHKKNKKKDHQQNGGGEHNQEHEILDSTIDSVEDIISVE